MHKYGSYYGHDFLVIEKKEIPIDVPGECVEWLVLIGNEYFIVSYVRHDFCHETMVFPCDHNG